MSKKFSKTDNVGKSKSLVGSSKIRKLGFSYSTLMRFRRRFSPPESLAIGEYCVCSSKRNSFKNWDADKIFPFANGKFSEISLMKFDSLNLSQDDLEKIMYKNAQKLLDISKEGEKL